MYISKDCNWELGNSNQLGKVEREKRKFGNQIQMENQIQIIPNP
jgi:hypothetical protein